MAVCPITGDAEFGHLVRWSECSRLPPRFIHCNPDLHRDGPNPEVKCTIFVHNLLDKCDHLNDKEGCKVWSILVPRTKEDRRSVWCHGLDLAGIW